MRKTYRRCKFCGDLHDVDNWPDNHREWIPDNRSELASPMIARDEMQPVKGMHDGKMYTSKAALRQSYRDHGVVEVGNDVSYTTKRPRADKAKIRSGVSAAVDRATSYVNNTTYTETKKTVRKRKRAMARGATA